MNGLKTAASLQKGQGRGETPVTLIQGINGQLQVLVCINHLWCCYKLIGCWNKRLFLKLIRMRHHQQSCFRSLMLLLARLPDVAYPSFDVVYLQRFECQLQSDRVRTTEKHRYSGACVWFHWCELSYVPVPSSKLSKHHTRNSYLHQMVNGEMWAMIFEISFKMFQLWLFSHMKGISLHQRI